MKMKTFVWTLGAAVAAQALYAATCITSGDVEAVAKAGSASAASAAITLTAGTLAAASSATPLDARDRTSNVSVATAFDFTPGGCALIIR